MNAQERRRAARAEKQSAWKQANPLLVGVSAKPDCRPILTLNRKPVDRVVKAVDTETEYHKQILAGAAKYVSPSKSVFNSKPKSEYGVMAVGRQKRKESSKPLTW